jgi:hypothetical protein
MPAKRQLGAILLESGRITQTDVDRVLDHQRTHGGFFGQAIVALGILRPEEIDWALASQFDLPFIFPNADAVDREAALLVPADWALAHLAVPIVKAGRTLTVVVADPLDNDTLDDLHSRTGLEVEMALASASRIRELVRSIYGDTGPVRPTEVIPVALPEFVTAALEAGADRIGISVRGTHATAWYTARGTRVRNTLLDTWQNAFEDMLDPTPFNSGDGDSTDRGLRSFHATLALAGADHAVDVQVLDSANGTEYLLRPDRTAATAARRTPVLLPSSVAAELRLLARTGAAAVGLPSDDDPFIDDIVRHLPTLAFGDTVRAAHITTSHEIPGIYSLQLGTDGAEILDILEDCDFDAVSVDLSMTDPRLARVFAAAPIAFMAVPAGADRKALVAAGINWLLHVSRAQDTVSWELRPVNR